jgi:hypothetical protein
MHWPASSIIKQLNRVGIIEDGFLGLVDWLLWMSYGEKESNIEFPT